ncbi:hypothetical protein [Microbacterium sp. BH-3-3-3]|uniref:hypothetical protein n=1 Tax=Microbacterium sp. BH-3-3-3 TaxID=1906742 RepID=UPI0011A8B5CF|nr:hypothetical protein [Microbacterium sp. BH-3-3-3]
MTVEAVRESTDAEIEAKMLRELRVLPFELRKHGRDSVTVTVDELDLLIRAANERDQLRREACAEPVTPGTAPRGVTPNMSAQYVIRECAACHHEPHGYLLPCNRQTCGCRDGRPKP